MKTLKRIFVLLLIILAGIGIYIASASVPSYRAQHLFFGFVLPPIQKLTGLERKYDLSEPFYGFAFEDPKNLQHLRAAYHLDQITTGAKTDFDADVMLMHWVRDLFPHAIPKTVPPPQEFDGTCILTQKEAGYLCGTASQLLIQSITALGGYARRVELRFTPDDQHSVVEVWSSQYNKWIVLDPDYDIYYMYQNIPQNAIELHQHWAAGRFDEVQVAYRDSPHNIYRKDWESSDPSVMREIFEKKDWQRWEEMRKNADLNVVREALFSVRLLNYYNLVSYPLRNDWYSRPLKWWHPEGNHVQDSLVIQLPTMRDDEDFLIKVSSPDLFYRSPYSSTTASSPQ